MVRGRVLAAGAGRLVVRNEAGVHELEASGTAAPGDVVAVEAGVVRVLTPARRPPRTIDHVLDPRRLRGLEARSRVEAAVREFFHGRGFRETRTPLLVGSPGMEPHIRPFGVSGGAFLPTSPEFAMKRLLVGGLERIFQLGPAFRDEPAATTHQPEFTLLEWYRAYAGLEEIHRDTEELVAHVATRLRGEPVLRFQGRTLSVAPPWPRLAVRDLFREHAGVDLAAGDLREACRRHGLHTDPSDTWDDLFHRLWLERIEPRLPADRAVFVTRYPASQAALAVVEADPDGSRWARRFEVFLGGLELANAFEELTDPVEQRRRFQADQAARDALHPDWPRSPLDEDFLAALEEGMPPAGGIALGIDRLIMLVADEPDLAYTMWLPAQLQP